MDVLDVAVVQCLTCGAMFVSIIRSGQQYIGPTPCRHFLGEVLKNKEVAK